MNISVVNRSYSGEIELHSHDYPQIVLPQSGSMEIEVNGYGGRVDWSQGVLVRSGMRHSFLSQTQNRFLVIDLPDDTGLDKVPAKAFFTITPALRHLLHYAHHNPVLTESLSTSQAWSDLVLSSLSLETPPSRQQRALNCATNYIQENLSGSLNARAIALAAGVSERQLYALFEQHMGCSPFTHVTQLRLDNAIDLLCNTHLPISEIALRVGYADQSALTHALKKNHQVPPGALRRQAFRHRK